MPGLVGLGALPVAAQEVRMVSLSIFMLLHFFTNLASSQNGADR